MVGPKMQNTAAAGPVLKRQKVQTDRKQSSAPAVRQSKIFAPFRVSSHSFPHNP